MYSLVRSQRATAHTLQNVSDVNRERSCLAAASSVCNSTKHNGLVTVIATLGCLQGLDLFDASIKGKNTENAFALERHLAYVTQPNIMVL